MSARPECAVVGCPREATRRGWCHSHYDVWRRTGEPPTEPFPATREQRFWDGADIKGPDECWLWNRQRYEQGYGRTKWAGKNAPAHRIAYTLAVGEIPEGLQIDHLCRNRACVNPNHLELVTPRENLLRGETLTARNAAKRHCPAGHPYDKVHPVTGWRRCLICERERDRFRRLRRRASRGGDGTGEVAVAAASQVSAPAGLTAAGLRSESGGASSMGAAAASQKDTDAGTALPAPAVRAAVPAQKAG